MDEHHPPWTVRWLSAIDEIDRRQWDRLALGLPTPLLEWHRLHDLEASGSISPATGWHPSHLTLWDRQKLVGAAPLYIKSHSDGEFIFDHWWAQLAGEYGIDYYPKMVGMSPATPSVGYRFLMAEAIDPQPLMDGMLSAIDRRCRERRLSCCHLNFVDPAGFIDWSSKGFSAWQHQSYLWQNQGFGSFDDYLKTFNASQRRNIRRERKRMQDQGIRIKNLTGDDIPTGMGETMYRYYLNTNARYGPWAARFLNGDFFRRIFRDFRHRLLVVAAYLDSSVLPLALAMLLVKDRHLTGRYWGCERPLKDLHFNMCFYAPIEWAIDNGVETFDPGAGSPHKIYRGFKAVANTSLHRFSDLRLKALFDLLVGQANAMERANIEALNKRLPLSGKP
ncbi:MAG: GNAT family N-acetyltransferase [Desulfosarcina sp.]